MAQLTNTNAAGEMEIIELRTTTSSSANTYTNSKYDGGGVDIDDKIRAMDGGNRGDLAGVGEDRKDGHRGPASRVDDDSESGAGLVMTETIEDVSRAAGDGDTGSGTVYKVYRRRWFGLVQLTLLNIFISWDVSVASRFVARRRARSSQSQHLFQSNRSIQT
ncbi:hypothetical protein NUW58_g9902 [Xylaria curta]|uniref:Uncharacterized protein n=1 Tax=Xylaria curta TaxID=42375 RepID=A0ACC1MSX7_9PEZI|nr:hypothetical protein NUW58_g9902 [Xylaria curta]